MHLLTVVGDKGARRHRHRGGRIEFGAGPHPPGTFQHRDETVMWVKMRMTEMVAREPFDHDDVKPLLRRIAGEDCILRAGRIRLSPFYLIGQLIGHGGRIQLGRAREPTRQKQGDCWQQE
jgi:hypothetical protein